MTKSSCQSASSAHSSFTESVNELAASLNTQAEWDTLIPITGMSAQQPTTQVGPVVFFEMTLTEFQRWGLLETGGRGIAQHWLDMQQLLVGNWAATIRVRAIDEIHAFVKARQAVAEALSVLRYAYIWFGRHEYCPRVGVQHPRSIDFVSTCVPVNGIGGTTSGVGADGLSTTVLTHIIPELSGLFQLSAIPPGARTELQQVIMNAVEWVGQAALSAVGPVRLVCLITALEILLIDDDEIQGKRRKLTSRSERIYGPKSHRWTNTRTRVDELYTLRSRCLHDGHSLVAEEDTIDALNLVSTVLHAYLTRPELAACDNLASVLDVIEPHPATIIDYQI